MIQSCTTSRLQSASPGELVCFLFYAGWSKSGFAVEDLEKLSTTWGVKCVSVDVGVDSAEELALEKGVGAQLPVVRVYAPPAADHLAELVGPACTAAAVAQSLQSSKEKMVLDPWARRDPGRCCRQRWQLAVLSLWALCLGHRAFTPEPRPPGRQGAVSEVPRHVAMAAQDLNRGNMRGNDLPDTVFVEALKISELTEKRMGAYNFPQPAQRGLDARDQATLVSKSLPHGMQTSRKVLGAGRPIEASSYLDLGVGK
ncbi:hypothetical protein AK812_SmicGene10735 [Symbiodinium microadriaticum]|uniref:Thioredoxin domain-containing protein n=1 Tax=Symbiodinium microadriaticum TaxID=2951 RepID=A0A1Q9EF24_SYMMI|nr:hypothetical protein AK812_SmicGene10735 [Symbiodinium microadriaticum]